VTAGAILAIEASGAQQIRRLAWHHSYLVAINNGLAHFAGQVANFCRIRHGGHAFGELLTLLSQRLPCTSLGEIRDLPHNTLGKILHFLKLTGIDHFAIPDSLAVIDAYIINELQ